MPEQPSTLRDMIQDALDNGVTYRELETRAVDLETGKKASRAIFHDIAHDKVDRMPYEHHLRAVAAALRVPYERVRQAAINQWVPEGANAEAEAERLEMIEELRGIRADLDRALAELDRRDREWQERERQRGTA